MASTTQKISCLILFHLFISMLYLIFGTCLLGLGLAERSTIPIKIVSVQLHAGNASVACGVIVILSAFLNCFFAVGRSGKFLEVYASIQVVVWVLMILVFAVLIDVDLEQRIHQALQEQVDTFDDSGGGVEPGPADFPTDINRIQQQLECCGLDMYTNWYAVHDHIPLSCCRRIGCNTYDPDAVFNEGCLPKLTQTIRQRLDKITAVSITILVLQFVQIVSTFMLSQLGHSRPIYGMV